MCESLQFKPHQDNVFFWAYFVRQRKIRINFNLSVAWKVVVYVFWLMFFDWHQLFWKLYFICVWGYSWTCQLPPSMRGLTLPCLKFLSACSVIRVLDTFGETKDKAWIKNRYVVVNLVLIGISSFDVFQRNLWYWRHLQSGQAMNRL